MAIKKVLLVDDVNLILELEKAFLKGLPVDITTARDGLEALEIVRRNPPDLIYLDIHMPIMDGPTCCRALKADPLTRDIPVIMVTTAGREQDEVSCRAAGCNDFITKPINSKAFLDKGRKCLADFERRLRRVSYTTDVRFLMKGQPQGGVITDISSGGLYIAVSLAGIPDDPMDVTFSLPIGETNVLLTARARIAWENKPGKLSKPSYSAGMGVEFIDLDQNAVATIEKFIESVTPVK